MSIFSRRRIEAMIAELDPWLGERKRKEYIQRIEHGATKQSLAAEAELGVLFALTRADPDARIEPEDLGGNRLIDAYSPSLFTDGPAALEVTALSDDTMAGREQIQRAARIITHFCNKIRKRSGKRLRFQFSEWSGRNGNWLERTPSVVPQYSLSEQAKEQLTAWLSNKNWPNPKELVLSEKTIYVKIVACESESNHLSAYSPVPALIYHPERNPIYRALHKKVRQLSGFDQAVIKCVVIVDVGCSVLTNLRPISSGGSQLIPENVISWAREKFGIDLVVVLSPAIPRSRGFPSNLLAPVEQAVQWQVTVFCDNQNEKDYSTSVRRWVTHLPAPRINSDLARQLHEQGAFSPAKNVATVSPVLKSDWQNKRCEMKISARLLQEFLAGRMTREAFERETFGGIENVFELSLARGELISDIRFESAGIDEDDDWVVVTLSDDPAARELK